MRLSLDVCAATVQEANTELTRERDALRQKVEEATKEMEQLKAAHAAQAAAASAATSRQTAAAGVPSSCSPWCRGWEQ